MSVTGSRGPCPPPSHMDSSGAKALVGLSHPNFQQAREQVWAGEPAVHSPAAHRTPSPVPLP